MIMNNIHCQLFDFIKIIDEDTEETLYSIKSLWRLCGSWMFQYICFGMVFGFKLRLKNIYLLKDNHEYIQLIYLFNFRQYIYSHSGSAKYDQEVYDAIMNSSIIYLIWHYQQKNFMYSWQYLVRIRDNHYGEFIDSRH